MQRNDRPQAVNEIQKQALAYAGEILKGVTEGVIHAIDTLIHPERIVDGFIGLGLTFYDAMVLTSAHSHTVPTHPSLPDLAMVQIAISRNPQLYYESLERMNQRAQNIIAAGQAVANANGPQRAGMIAEAVTGILVPIKMLDCVKAAANLHKFGVPHAPPLFTNYMGDLPRGPVPVKTLADIRAVEGRKNFLYVITQDMRLIISDTRFPFEVESKGVFGTMMTTHVHHHDLSKNFPIINGGILEVIGGKITGLDNSTGHFLAQGSSLGRITERLYRRNGFDEVRDIYRPVNVFGFLANQAPKNMLPPPVGALPAIPHGQYK